MSKEQEKPVDDKPFHFFHINYEGDIEEFKKVFGKSEV